MVNKRKFPYLKKINKRKSKVPVRYINRNLPVNPRITPRHHKNSWEALNAMYNHYRLFTNNEQINELNVLADNAEFRYGNTPLADPFKYSSDKLINWKNQSAMEIWPYTQGHGGYPFDINTNNPDTKWVIDYNRDLIHDFNKHLKTRQQHKDYEKLDNNILRKFRW